MPLGENVADATSRWADASLPSLVSGMLNGPAWWQHAWQGLILWEKRATQLAEPLARFLLFDRPSISLELFGEVGLT